MYPYRYMKQNYKLKYCEKLIARGLSHDQIIPLLKTTSSRNKNYWIERGYNDIEAQKMANSRMPGTIEYYTLYKNMSPDDAKSLVKKYQDTRANTKENFIRKYGELDGIARWTSYCEKHKIKNTFKYKNKKFGWTRDKFDQYNKSRSVTLENLINRHGEKLGREKWESYVARQSYTKSYKYVVDKYGQVEWDRLCKSKTNTYENFLIRHNNNIEIATEKYNEYLKSVSIILPSSRIADELFSNIINKLINTNYKQYYCNIHNQEWFLNIKNYGCVFLDFFLRDTGKVIEFYGDYWHANPIKYKPGSMVNLRSAGIKKVEEIWETDSIRISQILKVPYIKDVKIVWEHDFRKNPVEIERECIEFLTK